MTLLVERDEVWLAHYSGKAYTDSDLPEILNDPLNVIVGCLYGDSWKQPNNELLLRGKYDWTRSDEQNLRKHGNVAGLWSGYRSALVRDPVSKKLYRLKGVAFHPNFPQSFEEKDNIRINGGQKRINAEYEARMSKRFNKTLESVGIEPIMTPKGVWKYPKLCKRHRPTASIFEVKGDTRLDELVCIIEGLAMHKETELYKAENIVHLASRTPEGDNFIKHAKELMYDIGFVIGRLKKLMDRSGQTWSSESSASNAHWGNIVLYREDDKLKINLVDFDMSCDTRDFSKSKISALQRKENSNLMYWFNNRGTVSLRKITGKPFDFNHGHTIYPQFRRNLSEGFEEGYYSRKRKFSNELDIGRLTEIYSTLHADNIYSVDNLQEYMEDDYDALLKYRNLADVFQV